MKTGLEEIEDFYPLSPLQEGLLFHTVAAPRSGVYFNQCIATLRGDVKVEDFKQAWQRVVERHAILRTFFVWEGLDAPVQAVDRQVKLPFDIHDLRGIGTAEQQGRVESCLESLRERGFDLRRAPLMRLDLFQITEDDYEFIWSFHHLLLDGWSMFLLLKEVFAFYDACGSGRNLRLANPRPYRDYIRWLKGKDLEKAEVFWRETLRGFAAPTPTLSAGSGARVPTELNDTASLEIELSEATTKALKSLAQQHHVTLNTVIQLSWALLLSRYSGEDDVVFGTVVSGRSASLAGFEEIVGLLINTLPVRLRLSQQDSLPAALSKVQHRLTELLEYEYTPLADLQGWTEVAGHQSLFDSILMFENYQREAPLEELGASLGIHNVRWYESANYALTVLAIPERHLLLRIVYHQSRFEAASIRRMLGHVSTVLDGMVANPRSRLCDLPMITWAERHQLLVAWNDTRTRRPRDKCIHHLFEAQVVRTPDAVAVISGDLRLSYEELNGQANRLARHLRTLGVGPETLVGVCVERSVGMVVGLLGILKTGGAYVPLDPEYPPQRLAFMLADCNAPVIVTEDRFRPYLPQSGVRLLCLDTECEQLAGHSPENMALQVQPSNLAYVIYTSGSTGKPKGVAIEHRNTVALLSWVQTAFSPAELAGVLASTSLCFDLSVFELFAPLTNGGKVIVADNALDFPTIAAASEVTLLNTVPSAMAELVRAGGLPPSLQTVCLAGEPLPTALVGQIYELASVQRVYDLYGPSEDTTYSTRALRRADEPPNIGRPIANTQVYVLDRHVRPVPIGVIGELYIGGDGLARGYLNRPGLTAERFIQNPFRGTSGERLYKTGDQVRYLPDGRLEFIGRIDDQVKIRGFRVELGEIETALSQHPAVRQAVVMVRQDVSGEKRLTAYVIPDGHEGTVTIGHVRHFLEQKLPTYMLPQALMLLDALPLTPNGKVDRRALPAVQAGRPDLETDYLPPRTDAERTIAEIWQEALQMDKVGLHDNFFDLGGHSLLVMRVHGKLRGLYGTALSIVDMFKYPTVSSLAQHLSRPEASMSIEQTRLRAKKHQEALRRRRLQSERRKHP